MNLCVYALIGRHAMGPPLRGIAGERLRLVAAGTVAAVVGELPRAPAPSADSLRRYDRVVHRLSERFAAILPARFGTCFADADELTFVLRSRRQSLRAALDKVRGRVQVTIRVIAAAQEATTRPDTTGAGGADRTTGAAYLHSRAAAAARAREVPGFAPVRAAVSRWVRDERVETSGSVASVYHLIPRASAAAYRRAAERAAAAAALRVVVTGPWPPYAFSSTW